MAAHARDRGGAVSESGAVDDLRTEAIWELLEGNEEMTSRPSGQGSTVNTFE